MNQNNQEYYYRKINTTNSTPKSININQYNKTINYKISNTNINNNITNFIYPFTPIDKFNKKFLRDSEDTSQNSSDIKFEYSPSLKEQILSPEDDDINQKRNTYSTKNSNIYIDENYFLNYDIKPSQIKANKSKKILILDLDETLVHSSFYPFNSDDDDNKNSSDIFFTILFNQKYYDVYVLLRPYFTEFINKMSKIFNIYIFTASIKEYAEPLLIKLDKNNLIKKKLYRESCTLSEDRKYIKDLNTLNENLKNVILLDNNPNSYRYNKCNGLPIKTWHSEANDKELIKIIPFLTFLSTVDDVREYIPNIVDNDEINYDKVYKLLNKYNLDDQSIKNKCNSNINIKKCEKKLINIIKKNSNSKGNINNNKNKTYSDRKIKVSYPQLYTNNVSINKINNKENNYLNEQEKEQEIGEKIFVSSINFNKFEEKKNNNYISLNNNNTIKYFHSPATINFCEPPNMNDITKVKYNKNSTNNALLTKTNLSINKIKKVERNKYIRSKSSYNFNDLTENSKNKFSTINFNLINNNLIMENKNKTNSNITKSKKSKTKIKNYKSFNNNKHSYYNNYMKNPNDEKASLFLDSNVENYLFTLNQNENYKCANNHMINLNLNNNKSLEQKMSLSTRLMKVKNTNISNQKENMFRHRNVIENDKNEEIERISKYNLIRGYGLNNKNQIHNLKKSGKSKGKKVISGRNDDNIIKRNKNLDKFISVSNTNELNNNNDINNNINIYNNSNLSNEINQQQQDQNQINNKINYINKISKNTINSSTNNKMSLDNDNTIQKKTRCSTLNSHYMNNHHKKLKDIIEENKNNTMEINKSLKSRFFNNDNRLSINLKGINRKNKNYVKNYNKGNKTNKNINSEINLLNKFMKELEEKNSNNKTKENKTQRDSNYITNKNSKKNFNYNYDYYYINNKPKNLDNNNFYFTKRINNNKINKGNNTTYLRKNNKINFYDNDYMNQNQNDNEKNNEITNFIKNMKYSSLEKTSRKNRIQKYSEMGDKNNILINNKSNYLIKLYYSYANKKI